jgi:hypothetical protein
LNSILFFPFHRLLIKFEFFSFSSIFFISIICIHISYSFISCISEFIRSTTFPLSNFLVFSRFKKSLLCFYSLSITLVLVFSCLHSLTFNQLPTISIYFHVLKLALLDCEYCTSIFFTISNHLDRLVPIIFGLWLILPSPQHNNLHSLSPSAFSVCFNYSNLRQFIVALHTHTFDILDSHLKSHLYILNHSCSITLLLSCLHVY